MVTEMYYDYGSPHAIIFNTVYTRFYCLSNLFSDVDLKKETEPSIFSALTIPLPSKDRDRDKSTLLFRFERQKYHEQFPF